MGPSPAPVQNLGPARALRDLRLVVSASSTCTASAPKRPPAAPGRALTPSGAVKFVKRSAQRSFSASQSLCADGAARKVMQPAERHTARVWVVALFLAYVAACIEGRCGACGGAGHNRRTCPLLQQQPEIPPEADVQHAAEQPQQDRAQAWVPLRQADDAVRANTTAAPPKRVMHCGNCGQPGHNTRTCANAADPACVQAQRAQRHAVQQQARRDAMPEQQAAAERALNAQQQQARRDTMPEQQAAAEG